MFLYILHKSVFKTYQIKNKYSSKRAAAKGCSLDLDCNPASLNKVQLDPECDLASLNKVPECEIYSNKNPEYDHSLNMDPQC